MTEEEKMAIQELIETTIKNYKEKEKEVQFYIHDLFNSIILNTDSYKFSHFLQYPSNVKYLSSYIESRGGRWNRIIFYGLQMFLKEYLCKPITIDHINYAEAFLKQHGLPFNRNGWELILDKYQGYLPLKIEAAPEGLILPTNQVLVQVKNTDPHFAWLVSYIETALLRAIWYPVAVATNSYMCKQIIKQYLEMTGSPEQIDFKLHDFGARGVSSYESAGIGGSAHLLNFKGTDTTIGIHFAQKYYNAKEFPGFSIPASEHSTTVSWGRENEKDAYNNMIMKFGNGMFACVIDSYDTFNAIDNIWVNFKERLKDGKGTVVLRPDSGNPVAMASSCLEHMMQVFGYTVNSKGYKVLPNYVRMIYGDGIEERSIQDILRELAMRKISADNITFGMGGALLQHLNRDTLRFAMKASAISEDGKTWKGIQKDPITDPGKRSKPGRLALVKRNETYETVDESVTHDLPVTNILRPVFENGNLLVEYTFDEIRRQVELCSNQ